MNSLITIIPIRRIRIRKRPLCDVFKIYPATFCSTCSIQCLRYLSFSSSSSTIDSKSDSNSNNEQQQQQQQQRQLISILDCDKSILDRIPLEDVRNFCFIAHIDHGKSSLSSRLLELTGNLGKDAQKMAWKIVNENKENDNNNNIIYDDDDHSTITSQQNETNKGNSSSNNNRSKEQIELLDTLSVEQQRGITVKASTATMLYKHPTAIGPEKVLLINMFDSPGHVDFGREVSRSLCFVQGAILLLDATQGIQAQTWSVYEKAKKRNDLELLIALTKVDLPSARPIHVALTVSEWLCQSTDPDDIILTSARNRIGIYDILEAVCTRIPSPKPLLDDDDDDNNNNSNILRAIVADSWYDNRGVNCLVQIHAGSIQEGDRIALISSESDNENAVVQQQQTSSYSVQEVGILLPKPLRTTKLHCGQMGYVRFGLRDPRQAKPGTVVLLSSYINKKDTLILPTIPVEETITKSVLYASVHPINEDGFEELCTAIDKLALNDTGLEVQKMASTTSAAAVSSSSGSGGGPFLGPGIRIGFQGLLHVEVFRQRLQDEFHIDAVVTPPKVPYVITYLPTKSNNITTEYTKTIEDLSEWPEYGTKFKVKEPIVDVRIIARVEDAGAVMELITRKRGKNILTKPIDEEKWVFTARVPWGEVVTDFHDQLKNVTAGYGSLDTSEANPPLEDANLCKVDIMLNGDIVEPLAFVSHKDVAQSLARVVCKKLKDVLPRQQFVIVIQAKADGKIVCSERIKAYRKDVLTKSGKVVGGGDMTRKMKLLEKQKKGKKRMQNTGKVTLSQAAFNSVITRSS